MDLEKNLDKSSIKVVITDVLSIPPENMVFQGVIFSAKFVFLNFVFVNITSFNILNL